MNEEFKIGDLVELTGGARLFEAVARKLPSGRVIGIIGSVDPNPTGSIRRGESCFVFNEVREVTALIKELQQVKIEMIGNDWITKR